MSGAWARGTNSAVNSAPARGSFTIGGDNSSGGGAGHRSSGGGGNRRSSGNNNNNHRGSYNNNRGRNSQNNDNDNNNNSGRGGGRGGRGGRGRGRGRGGRGNDNRNSQRIYHKDIQLLTTTGLGKTKEQQRVKRINNREFMRLRLEYLEPSDSIPFNPHEQCHWVDENRVEVIKLSSLKAMELGDVSKNRPDKAPAADDVAPLAKNEETRWKSKAMKENRGLLDEVEEKPPETTEEIVAKTRLILNKVSWTTLDRMTDQFMETAQIETNEDVRKVVIHLLIQKSQREHHFGPLYANLCAIIAKKFKPFKKELLTQCQHEFDQNTAEKIAEATKGMTDKDEIEYHTLLIRKEYLGHMKFLGELYKRDVVKLAIMTYCLDELLKEEENEDSIECFAELMTTMGAKLDGHAKKNNKPFDWDRVVALRKSNKISNRIKFLLQDLLDLKNNDWVSRRQKEVAVNLKDLHKDIAKEEKGGGSNKQQNNRRSSANSQASSSLRRTQSVSNVPVADDDGFVEINRSSLRKVSSKVEILQPEKDGAAPPLPKKADLRRTQSQPSNMKEVAAASTAKAKKAPLSPDECGDKAKNMLKEYFVGGDTDDAILTVNELVQVGTAGDVERGTKVVESSVFLVMEMKKEEASKCAIILSRAFKEGKIPADSFSRGFSDPLEFLNDVEIDAPLAGTHLAHIVSEAIKVDALELDPLLKNAPQDFKEFGKPAVFCAKVLKGLGKDSDADIEMIGSLMTDFEKTKYESAKKLYEAV